MVAMLAFGGTFAYFTATTENKGLTGIKTATIQLGANAVADAITTKVQSGSKLASGVTVTNKSNVESYIFIKFDVTLSGAGIDETFNTAHKKADKDAVTADGDYCLLIEDLNTAATETTDKWTALTGHAGVYYTVAAATETDKILDVCGAITFYGKSESNGDTAGSLMNKDVTVTIATRAIQKLSETTGDLTAADAFAQVNFG